MRAREIRGFVGASDFGMRERHSATSFWGLPPPAQADEALTVDALTALLARWMEAASAVRTTGKLGRHVVYRLFDVAGQLLYVGVTSRGQRRLQEHAHSKTWWDDVASVTFEHFATRRYALTAEARAIRTEEPRHNIARPSEPGEPPRLEPGAGRRTIRGIKGDAWATTTLYQTEVWGALERQSARYFGMDGASLIAAFESGEIPTRDPRLRYVVNLLSAIRLEDEPK